MPNDFRLIPGTLPDPYCFTNFQQLNVDLFSIAQVVNINGAMFYNLGPGPIDADHRDWPWFDTNDFNWYAWSQDVGLWVRYHPIPASSQSRQLWVGNTTDLQLYDGGDANPPGDASGPMWEVDTNFAAKFPVGPGTFAGGGIVAVTGTGGNDEQTIPATAIPAHQHIVSIGVNTATTGEPAPGSSPGSVQYGIGKTLAVGAIVDDSTGHVARSYPLTSQYSSDPPPATPTAKLNMLPPYYGVYFIKRSQRLFFVAP